MRATRSRQLLALLATLFAVALLGTVPASAATVDCGDLRTQRAAQSYLEGPSADAARLDADGDGRACEANTATSNGIWTVLGLGGLIVAVLVGDWVVAKLESTRVATTPPSVVRLPAVERTGAGLRDQPIEQQPQG